MTVLYGQPDHLSTSIQTAHLVSELRNWFDIKEYRIGSPIANERIEKVRRVLLNLVWLLRNRSPAKYLLYANDGVVDVRLCGRSYSVVYWYDTPWDYAAQPPSIFEWVDWLRCNNVKRADYVFGVSSTQVTLASQLRRGDGKGVHYLPVGVDCRMFDPESVNSSDARNQYSIPENSIVIGYVGYFGLVNGKFSAQALAEGAETVLSGSPNAHYLIVGFGPGLELFKGRIRDQNLESRFTFTGRLAHAEIPMAIAAMDICIDTLEDGFHSLARSETKLKQYMAMGKACVGTGIGENIIDLDHGNCGILVDTSSEDLAKAIATLIGDASLRIRLGRRARQRALEIYDWPILARSMAQALLAKAIE